MVYASEHELRHDAVTARAARTLREAEGDPLDWIEGPRQGAERVVLAPGRQAAADWRRAACVGAACAIAAAAVVGLILAVEGLR